MVKFTSEELREIMEMKRQVKNMRVISHVDDIQAKTNTSVENSVAEVGDDNISSLPNDIVSEILSRLPIKDAVRTSVLSKHWEAKWTRVYNVNVDQKELHTKLEFMAIEYLVEFVERIFINLQHIRSFGLNLSFVKTYGICQIISGISALLRRNIESLELRVSNDDERWSKLHYNHEAVILPRSLLHCVSLKNLVIEMPCIFKVAVRNGFTNLKSLKLFKVEIKNENASSDTVIFDFPVLKTFDVEECKWLNMKFVEINAPSLTIFRSINPKGSAGNKVNSYTISIIGAMIEELTTWGYPEHLILVSSTVSYAYVNCRVDDGFMSFEECGLHARNLLRQLSRAVSLHLTKQNDLFKDTALKRLGFALPRFLELKRLHLIQSVNVGGLLEFLHAAPFLKYLSIDMRNVDCYDYKAVDSIPSCLASHLEKLELDYSRCSLPKSGLPKFLLKNGKQLKNVYIRGGNVFPADDIIAQLQTFPKGSTCLAIECNNNASFC